MFNLLPKQAMMELIAESTDVAILFMESLHELVGLFLHDNHSMFGAFIATAGSK